MAMMPSLPIAEALADQHLLGAGFGDIGSWQTWAVVLKDAFAAPGKICSYRICVQM
jgi:hypothetical protein